ncbi:MAG: hypothetical protein WBN01_07820, partial [Polyangiales bacterium]
MTISVSDDGFDHCVDSWTIAIRCVDEGGTGGTGGDGVSGLDPVGAPVGGEEPPVGVGQGPAGNLDREPFEQVVVVGIVVEQMP